MKTLLAMLRSFRFTEGGVSRPRIAMLVLAFAAVHLVIAGRLVLIGVKSDPQVARRVSNPDMLTSTRPDILDREGKQLATDVQSAMLYAEPRKGVGYVDDAVDQLRTVLPELDERELREKLSSKKGFVRLKREITAEEQHEIRKLGIPHVGFLQESKRIYPAANEASHVLGGVNVDSVGIAGLEKWIDSGGLADLHMAGFATGRSRKPREL
jgi:cell division protein FtsI (penicillin-binding protein 3)